MDGLYLSHWFVFLTVIALLVTVSVYVYGGAQSALPMRSFGDVKVNKNLQVNGTTTTRVETFIIFNPAEVDLTFSKDTQRYYTVGSSGSGVTTTQVNIPSASSIISLFPYDFDSVNDDGASYYEPVMNFGRIVNNYPVGGDNLSVYIEDYVSGPFSNDTDTQIVVYGSTVTAKTITITPGNYINLVFKRRGNGLTLYTS